MRQTWKILTIVFTIWTIEKTSMDTCNIWEFETLITVLTIENLNSWQSLLHCDTGQHSQFLRCLGERSLWINSLHFSIFLNGSSGFSSVLQALLLPPSSLCRSNCYHHHQHPHHNDYHHHHIHHDAGLSSLGRVPSDNHRVDDGFANRPASLAKFYYLQSGGVLWLSQLAMMFPKMDEFLENFKGRGGIIADPKKFRCRFFG